MSATESRLRVVDLKYEGGFEFRVSFSPEIPDLLMDESPPLGGGKGPEAASVLAAAIGNCLSASLLLCLQKSHLEVAGLETRVEAAIDRNEQGRFRVTGTSVEIRLDIGEGAKAKFDRCASLFEDYCIVTESVRHGIPVSVTIVDPAGNELHRSTSENATT
jgi:uncharacterized OsmC-like protein